MARTSTAGRCSRTRPIQGEIVNVLRRITQENVQLHGAGRTDAGVHALGQIGSFRTQSTLCAGEFQRALNALLPPTIRIVAAEEVGPRFQRALVRPRQDLPLPLVSRKSCSAHALALRPCTIRFRWTKTPCATPRRVFVGMHDFASFAASTGSEEDDKERSTDARDLLNRAGALRGW